MTATNVMILPKKPVTDMYSDISVQAISKIAPLWGCFDAAFCMIRSDHGYNQPYQRDTLASLLSTMDGHLRLNFDFLGYAQNPELLDTQKRRVIEFVMHLHEVYYQAARATLGTSKVIRVCEVHTTNDSYVLLLGVEYPP